MSAKDSYASTLFSTTIQIVHNLAHFQLQMVTLIMQFVGLILKPPKQILIFTNGVFHKFVNFGLSIHKFAQRHDPFTIQFNPFGLALNKRHSYPDKRFSLFNLANIATFLEISNLKLKANRSCPLTWVDKYLGIQPGVKNK